jgi:hypothetical protein
MNMRTYALLALLAAGPLTGCSGASTSTVSSPTPSPPAAVKGVDTPKSVSVVTAN